MCYRFPCGAPSYLSNIFLLLGTGHLEKRQVTLLCHSAVPELGVPHFLPDLRVYSDVATHGGESSVSSSSSSAPWFLALDLPDGLSQFRYPVLLFSDMTNDGHDIVTAFLKTMYCLFQPERTKHAEKRISKQECECLFYFSLLSRWPRSLSSSS